MSTPSAVTSVQPADYARVVAVWEASVRATHHFIAESDIAIFRPMVRDALPHIRDLVCVRNAAGQVAGFAAVVDRKVEMLFIHPDDRGTGIGRALLRYAVDQLGATHLDVNEQNAQAVGFYLHMGFEVIGRSDRDGTGKPYPLLHLRAPGVSEPDMLRRDPTPPDPPEPPAAPR